MYRVTGRLAPLFLEGGDCYVHAVTNFFRGGLVRYDHRVLIRTNTRQNDNINYGQSDPCKQNKM